jgi:hypothetical protein
VGGPVGARPCEGGGGGPGHGVRSSWEARTRAHVVGRRQPGDGNVGSHAGEAGEEREGRESGGGWPVGQPMEWIPPVSEGKREKGREWQVGPGLRLNVFKLVQKRSNLIRPKINLLKLQTFELKYRFDGFDEGNNFLHRNFS